MCQEHRLFVAISNQKKAGRKSASSGKLPCLVREVRVENLGFFAKSSPIVVHTYIPMGKQVINHVKNDTLGIRQAGWLSQNSRLREDGLASLSYDKYVQLYGNQNPIDLSLSPPSGTYANDLYPEHLTIIISLFLFRLFCLLIAPFQPILHNSIGYLRLAAKCLCYIYIAVYIYIY